jgi:hypothetical protein
MNGGVAQVVECLLYKYEVLNSNCTPTKKKEKKAHAVAQAYNHRFSGNLEDHDLRPTNQGKSSLDFSTNDDLGALAHSCHP